MLMKEIEALPEEYVADVFENIEHYFTIGEKLWNYQKARKKLLVS